jgi:hypothetical protein
MYHVSIGTFEVADAPKYADFVQVVLLANTKWLGRNTRYPHVNISGDQRHWCWWCRRR